MQAGPDTPNLPLKSRLAEQVLVCDGAMGTMLDASGVSIDRCRPELSLSRPDLVRAIHRAFISAGADIIETNSFMANRVALARFGLEAHVERINMASAALAREVCNERASGVLVAGSIGPAVSPRMARTVAEEAAVDALVEQLQYLERGGVDLLIFETFGHLDSLVSAIHAAKEVSRLPVIAQMTFLADGRTISGESPESVARELDAAGVLALGINCALGPNVTKAILDRLAKATDTFLSVQPNAGPPTLVNGRFQYPENEEYFGRCARQFVELGASIVGGCCGTTPRHVKEIARSVRGFRPRRPSSRVSARAAQSRPEPAATHPSGLRARFDRGEFVVACELRPPDGTDPARAVESAARVREAGADLILIGPTYVSRVPMSPLSYGLLVRERLGMDSVVTATTFEKSAITLQADLLGAHSFGLQNVLCRTGTVVPQGEYPTLGSIFEMTSLDLMELLRLLNEGRDRSGDHTGRATSFVIGGRVRPSARDFEAELARALRKIAAGAHFLVTEPVFDITDLRRFVDALPEPRVPVLLGVTAVTSLEHAEYLLYETQSGRIPESLLERLRAGNAHEAGLRFASELVWQAAGLVQGVVAMPASGDGAEGAELLEASLGWSEGWNQAPKSPEASQGTTEQASRPESDASPESSS